VYKATENELHWNTSVALHGLSANSQLSSVSSFLFLWTRLYLA